MLLLPPNPSYALSAVTPKPGKHPLELSEKVVSAWDCRPQNGFSLVGSRLLSGSSNQSA